MPVQTIREEFNRILHDSGLWDKRVGILQVTNLTDKTVEVRLLISTANSGNGFDLRCILREALLKFILENYSDNLPKTRIVIADKKVM